MKETEGQQSCWTDPLNCKRETQKKDVKNVFKIFTNSLKYQMHNINHTFVENVIVLAQNQPTLVSTDKMCSCTLYIAQYTMDSPTSCTQ